MSAVAAGVDVQRTQQGYKMNSNKKMAMRVALIASVLSMTACAGMSTQDKNTAIGAGVGAVAGGVLTGGSTVGVVGGAAVGGVIGNQVK
jgi:osmotically inducible lipoprotein OsmB